MNILQISDIIADHKQTIYDRFGKPPEFSLSSLPTLNKKLWGFRRGKLCIIAGRPGGGKSLLLLQLAYDFALSAHTVYFFSFEMSPSVCAERLISNRCSIDNFNLTTGRLSPREKENIENFQQRTADLNLHIFDSVGQTLPEFKEIIGNIHGKPDIVIIDYGNLVKEEKGKTKKQSYDEYIKGLRALAIRNKFCVIMGSQINREIAFRGKVREAMLTDLKDTGELEQSADLVILLHYPYSHTHEEEDKGEYIIKVGKNRDGRVGRQICKIIPEHCRIAEVEDA